MADPEPKPRIAVVTALFPTREQLYRGQAIYFTTRALTEFAEVRVFCPTAEYPDWLRPVRFHYVPSSGAYTPEDVAAEYFRYPAVPLVSRPLNGYMCARRLTPRLRAWRPDVILSYWLYPDGFAAVLAGHKLGIPVVVGSRGSDLLRIGDRATAWFTRRTLRRAAQVLTVSEDLRRHAIQQGARAENVTTVRNGCEARLFGVNDRAAARAHLGIPTEARLVLYVGRLDPGKGIEDLLSAAQRMQAPEGLRMVFLGEGTLQAEFRRSADALGVASRVSFAGACRREEVARWIAACDLLALPSYSEGCPNVVLEAITGGRPVVATTVGGIPEVVNDRCGILVPPGDVEQLARALGRALDADWDPAAIAAQFRRSWRQVAAETMAVCSRLMHDGAAARAGVPDGMR
jgi:teichuronic acid biosynthesis glycosyltransferase TuaC